MKKALNASVHVLVWGIILWGCVAILAALGLFGILWRFFKWLASL